MIRPELSQDIPAGLTQSLANIGHLFSPLENESVAMESQRRPEKQLLEQCW